MGEARRPPHGPIILTEPRRFHQQEKSIILAMEDAVKRGAQVINLSLGDQFGDPLSPESSAANNAMLAGVIVCIAAGNSGPSPRSIGAPGAAHHVITVGASTDDGVTALMALLEMEGTEAREVEMRLMDGSPKLPAPAMVSAFVDCGLGAKPADFSRSVRGRIALVQRGDITFLEKATNAQNAGATACVIYNNRVGGFFGTLGDEKNTLTIPVVSISQEDGQLMLTSIEDRKRVSGANLRLNPEEVPQPNRLAEFSSRGPNRDGWIKPELTAPGVNITSTTITEAPRPGGGMPDPSGYVVASGTSMATPHVAGAAALIRQAHPTWTTLQVKAALVNTADFMFGQGQVMDQGAGAMNLPRAIECRAVLTTADSPASPTHSFGRVSNQGGVVRVSKALAIHPISEDPDSSLFTLSVGFMGKPAGLSGELSVNNLGCDEGCAASFELTLIADGAVLQDGSYSGWVMAETTWGTLRLPFCYEAVKVLTTPPEPGVDSYFEVPIRRVPVGSLPNS